VIPGDRETEQQLHRQFAPFRVRLEWFKHTSAIDKFIVGRKRVDDQHIEALDYADQKSPTV
jgi:hypothetical protein